LSAVLKSLLASAALLAACGCSVRGTGRDYMPLAVGNRWDYRVVTSNGSESFRRLMISSKVSNQAFRGAEGNGTSLWSWQDDFLSVQRGGQRIYLLALPAVKGTSWWTVTPKGIRVWCRVEGTATVKTAAGTFNRCVEVLMEPVGGRTEIRHWFAPGVGWVRYSYGPRGGRPWMVRELVAYVLRAPEPEQKTSR
jgi:hypothetical protein